MRRRLVLGITLALGLANAVAGIVAVAAPGVVASTPAIALFCHLPG